MTPGDDASYDVRVWAIRVYKSKRGTSYTVKWQVAGTRHQRTFATRKLAESFRAGLITATRGGAQFFASDGLPASMRTSQMGRSWYAHACAFMDMKWAHASPGHRRSLADALVSVTVAMVNDSRDMPDSPALRKALSGWSFNLMARGHLPIEEADVPNEIAREVAWIARRSLPLRSFASPATVRRAMDAISVKLDGTAAAAPTVARKRAALFSALQYAVELELLPHNPLKQLKLRRPIVAEAVDRRVVVNHAQARALLAAVRETYPALEAYFACLYHAALRKCVYGQDDVAKARIEAALALTADDEEPDVAETSPRIPPRTAVDIQFDPITAGPPERALHRRFRWSRALCARGGR